MSVIQQEAASLAQPRSVFDVERIRRDFPVLRQRFNGKPLIYLDNAATSQRPWAVIEAVERFYREQNASVHRGVHHLSQQATELYETARKKVQKLLHAPLTCEVIFTRGATEGVNLVAQSYGRMVLKEGDEVLITALEHHSNIVPWQLVCEQTGAKLRVAPINDAGEVILNEYEKLLTERVKIAAISHVSNALGTVNPVKDMTRLAHAAGAVVLVDGAQAAPHFPVDVKDIDCDFYVCSAHKMLGPTGVGILFGKAPILDSMPPYHGGGAMIMSVTFEKTTFNSLPYKFEAGTPNIEGAIGFGEACAYLESLGMNAVHRYESELLDYGTRLLEGIPGVRLIGTAAEKAAVLSFVMDIAHPHDIGQIFDGEGIAIRAGHHCAQPVMQRFGVPATARISLAFYNTMEELDAAARAIEKVKEVFA